MPMYYLYEFAEKPPAKQPAGLSVLSNHGMYLTPEKAMKFLRGQVKDIVGGKATTHLGLYDADGKLVHTEKWEAI